MAKAKLNDVAVEARQTWKQNKTDVPVVGLEHLEPDEIWLRRWDLNPDENTFTKGFREGQLLFGRRRAYQKKMSVASCDGICSGDITVIAARPEKILPELLPFYLRTDSFFDFAVRGSGGSLSPRVKWSHISDYEFDLPPMKEQKKLAELLWAANDLKEKYKNAITATDEMLKAKFREMFGECGVMSAEGGVEDLRRGAEARSQLTERNLGDLASFITSGSRGWAKYYAESGSYFITIKNIRGGKIRLDNMDYVVPPNDMEAQRTKVQYNDLLISITADLGRTAVVSKEIADYGAYINQHISCVRLNSDVVDPFYASYYLESDMGKQQFQLMNQKSVKAGLNFDAVKAIKILLPPLSLQREFVAIADKAESAKANLKKSIAAIDQVMKGLING